MRRFAITGPESSGKTTLAKELSICFKGNWIEEYAREYLMAQGGEYTFLDLEKIAQGQLDLWKTDSSLDIVFYDTEMLVMKVWSDYKFGTCCPFILEALENQLVDHYFLCKPDIEWEEDPLRENSETRNELFEIYLKELKLRNSPFTIIEGTLENRIRICKEIISRS